MLSRTIRRTFGNLDFATIDPRAISGSNPGLMMNLGKNLITKFLYKTFY